MSVFLFLIKGFYMVSVSALFGVVGKIVEPLLKLFMKRYQQPKLYMTVKFKEKFVREGSKHINPPANYTLYRDYTITVRNNSEYTAYRLMVRPPEGVAVFSVTPTWEYHKPLLIHDEYIFDYQVRKPFYGSAEEAEAALKNWSPRSFRIEYANLNGKSYYTEYHFGKPMETQNQFGSK